MIQDHTTTPQPGEQSKLHLKNKTKQILKTLKMSDYTDEKTKASRSQITKHVKKPGNGESNWLTPESILMTTMLGVISEVTARHGGSHL